MLTIRLRPQGRIHRKQYRIVVAQKHRHVTKKTHEDLGFYDPVTKEFKVNEVRVQHYLALNTEISETVTSLFKKHNLIAEKSAN